MNTYEECRECQRRIRRFKYQETQKRKREMVAVIVIMILVFGYLIWQVNRNFEEYPVYATTIMEYDQISTYPDIKMVDASLLGSDYQLMELPIKADDKFKTYMDFNAITNKDSKQWNLQKLASTDENGFRKFNGCYLVAIGTYYADEVGETFRVTLEDGKEIFIMTGDIKMNKHTDVNNQYVPANGNILEFIVDADKLDPLTKKLGDISNSGISGAIIKIEKIIY